MKRALLFLFVWGSFAVTQAQTLSQSKEITSLYTIQLGTFDENIKQADFEAIRSYAYVYKRDGQVFVGSFTTEEAAEPILEKIKAKGFGDAHLAVRSLKAGKLVYVIQIATKNAGEPIDWKNYSRAGVLYTIPNGAQVRFVHGAYEDKNDANVKLKEIVALGFADAFVRGVKDVQLNPITDFDTSDKSVLVQPTPPSVDVATKGVLKDYNNVPTKMIKRKSVMKLQDALRELGQNGGTTDGLYGKQTQALYDNALKSNHRLVSYNTLAQKHKGFENWEDGRLLLTMARELSIKNNDNAIVADLFNNLPTEKLSDKEATTALNWHSNLWKKLETWSAKGEYNDQVYTAFKVAYYHTLAHLEDQYAAKGITGEAGTSLSVSVIKTLIADDLEGFN